MRRRAREHGVTLIELMAVVAIIGILVALGLRISTRTTDAGRFARTIHGAMLATRRAAMNGDVMQYRAAGPFQFQSRALCMPATRLKIQSAGANDRVESEYCQLRDPPPPGPNTFPCTAGVVDDCTWKASQVYNTPAGYEIAKVKRCQDGACATTNAEWVDGSVLLYYRYDGSTDVMAGGMPGLGYPNETLEIYVRPVGVADATCTGGSGRCFKVLSKFHRVASRWD